MKAFERILMFVALSLLAACGGSTPNEGGPIRVIRCPVPVPPPTMLYPMNGATNVPDGNFTLVYAFIYGTSVSLVPATATLPVAVVRTAVPSPLPSPAATPEPGHAPVAFAVPPLQSHMTYKVYSLFTPLDTSCTPASGLVGSFTTQ